MGDLKIKVMVALDEETLNLLEEFKRANFLDHRSAAIRKILRDYLREWKEVEEE